MKNSALKLPMLVCLLSLFVFTGCEKPPYIETVSQTPYLGLPTGMVNIFSLNVDRLRNREGFKELTDRIVKEAGIAGSLDEAIRDLNLGFDPLNDIDLLIFGERGIPDPNNPLANMVFIARGDFEDPESKLERFNEWMAGQWLIAPPPFTQTTHPGTEFKRFQTRAQSQYNESLIVEVDIGFPTDHMMVVAFQSPLFNETLDIMAGNADGLASDAAWLAMIGRANTGAMIWGTGNISAPDIKTLQSAVPMGMQSLGLARQFYFDIDVVKEFSFNLGLVCQSIDDSEKLAAEIKNGINQVKGFLPMVLPNAPKTVALLNRLVVLAQLETTKLSLTLTKDQRVELADEWEELGNTMGLNDGLMPPIPGGLGGARR